MSFLNLNSVFSYLIPKNKVFHQLFCQSSENLIRISQTFSQLVHEDVSNQAFVLKEIKADELRGDEITNLIYSHLDSDFIIPFDREDIHMLATALDDVADSINSAATRIEMYKVERFSPAMEHLAEIIEKQAKEIDVAIRYMESMRNLPRIKEALVRINSFENEADEVLESAVGTLFERERDAVRILKAKEILDDMEIATDKGEDVANIIETIVIKLS